MRNAAARTPHPKPTVSKSRFNINGKQTPPREDPETVIPVASPRLLRNHVLTDVIAVWKLCQLTGGIYIKDNPNPVTTPWARKNW
jgi:hypothetical protein